MGVDRTTRDVLRYVRALPEGTEFGIPDLRDRIIYRSGPSAFPLVDASLRSELKTLEAFGELVRTKRSPARYKLNTSEPRLPADYVLDRRDGWIHAPKICASGGYTRVHWLPDGSIALLMLFLRSQLAKEPPEGVKAEREKSGGYSHHTGYKVTSTLQHLEAMTAYVSDLSYERSR